MKSTPPSPAVPDRHAEPPIVGEYNGFPVYPMPFFATLTSSDPEALGRWYERALGFAIMLAGPLVHLRRRKYQDLLITRSSNNALPRNGGATLRFDAEGELDALAAQARSVPALGHAAITGPVDTLWNTRELTVTDPEGHQFIFSARRAVPDPELEAQMRALLDAGGR